MFFLFFFLFTTRQNINVFKIKEMKKKYATKIKNKTHLRKWKNL